MDILQIITLAIIQGLTEFLPISSSAHLILVPHLTGWQDQGVAFDVALHIGTLIAVMLYFRKDLLPLLNSWYLSLSTRRLTAESRLAWGIILGTIPAAIIGFVFAITGTTDLLRTIQVITITTILFGLLLGWADFTGKRERNEYTLTWKDIFIIGFAQALSLIPGTSRSGVTMTAALLLGLNRKAAARFSFLLSIPIIMLAGTVETALLIKQNDVPIDWVAFILGMTVSALSAYLCIHAFIKFLEQIGMLPFVLYRLGLGIILLTLVG